MHNFFNEYQAKNRLQSGICKVVCGCHSDGTPTSTTRWSMQNGYRVVYDVRTQHKERSSDVQMLSIPGRVFREIFDEQEYP